MDPPPPAPFRPASQCLPLVRPLFLAPTTSKHLLSRVGFRPQIQKLEPPYKTASFTQAGSVKGKIALGEASYFWAGGNPETLLVDITVPEGNIFDKESRTSEANPTRNSWLKGKVFTRSVHAASFSDVWKQIEWHRLVFFVHLLSPQP